MLCDFSGKRILVTGGASGIGAACCGHFVAAGGAVHVADRRPVPTGEEAAPLATSTTLLDIADPEAVRRVVASIEEEHGPIDVLVNAAGVLQRTLPPEELTSGEWDRIFDVHLRGTYTATVAVGTRMAARGQGSIVTIASVAGMVSGPVHAYGPAKAALIHLTSCLAGEWGRSGVRVNAVSPGFTSTPAIDKGIAQGTLDPAVLAEASAIGRMVRPEEVAAAVLFLSSDCASGITGVNLPVDLGHLAATGWSAYGGVRPPRPLGGRRASA